MTMWISTTFSEIKGGVNVAKEKTYRYKMCNPTGRIPKGGVIEKDILLMPRLMRPKEIAKYELVDLNKGFKKLTIYRSSIGMKQSRLAEITGLSIKTIQSWEIRGMNEAKAIRAVKVADALKCSVKDLMED